MRDNKKDQINLDRLPKILFAFSLCILIFFYGFATHRYNIFPYSFLIEAKEGFNLLLSQTRDNKKWYYQKTNYTESVVTHDHNAAYNGPSLIASFEENDLSVRVINMDGSLIHRWEIDWFEIWPDATHLPERRVPKSPPGTHIHGTLLLKNGDLIFNFEYLGLVRLDVCGNVVWRLPYSTHHSIYQDENNNLWVSGQKIHENYQSGYLKYDPFLMEPMVLKISEEGEILNEISILDVIRKNKLDGLLHMAIVERGQTEISGDILHLNDVETFPRGQEEGIFEAGDIMVSLKHINTVLIFSGKDQKVKRLCIGEFVGQHDPDFIDGNTISIFDNNNITFDNQYNQSPNRQHQSRIIIKSFADDQSYVYYTGSEDKPFFTSIMGKNQWLQNGNLLITETMKGRAFEVDKNGEIVWEYINVLGNGYIGIIEEAQRLPNKYTKEFFNQRINNCQHLSLN